MREVTKKKITYLLSKRTIRDVDVYALLKDFFKEFLEAHYEFTFDELHSELTKIYLENSVKKKLIDMIDKFRAVEYQDEDIPQDVLRDVLSSFSSLIDDLIKAEEKKGFFDRLKSRDMPFMKKELLQKDELLAQKSTAMNSNSSSFSTPHDSQWSSPSIEASHPQVERSSQKQVQQSPANPSTESSSNTTKLSRHLSSVDSANSSPSPAHVQKQAGKSAVAESKKKNHPLHKTISHVKNLIKKTTKSTPIKDWTKDQNPPESSKKHTVNSWSATDPQVKAHDSTESTHLVHPASHVQSASDVSSNHEIILPSERESQATTTAHSPAPSVDQTHPASQVQSAPVVSSEPVHKVNDDFFDLTSKSSDVDLDSLAKELDDVISGKSSNNTASAATVPLSAGSTLPADDLSLLFSQIQSLISTKDIDMAKKKYDVLLDKYEHLPEDKKTLWFDKIQQVYTALQ